MKPDITFGSSLLFWLFLLLETANAQTIPVTGRVVDNAVPLAGFNVAVFTSDNGADPYVDRGVTDSDGKFRILSSITDVKQQNNSSPLKYNLSASYPNPASGFTNIRFSVPSESEISIKVFDILGQQCLTRDYPVTAGTWTAGIDLKELASGLYIVGVFSDGKLIGANKILLNHSLVRTLNNSIELRKVSDFVALNKSVDVRFIDSIIVSGPGYRSSVLRNVGFVQGDSVDVGDVEMYSGLVNADVFVYDLFNWRDKVNNPIVGAVVHIGLDSVVTDASGRGSFVLPATNVPYDVRITHPDIRTRETKVIVDRDKGLEFDVMTMESYPDSIYNFIHLNFMVYDKSARWLHRPDFIFNVDTTTVPPRSEVESWMQWVNFDLAKLDSFVVPFSENPVNPEGFMKDYRWSINPDTTSWLQFMENYDILNTGKYFVEWYDSLRLKYGFLALTGNVFNFDTGELYVAFTTFDTFKYLPLEVWRNIDRGAVHEFDTGIYLTARYEGPGVIASVSNRGPSYEVRNYTPNDLPIRLYLLARPPGVVRPPEGVSLDKDNGWCQYTPESIRKVSNNLMASYTFTMEDGRTLSYQEKINDFSEFKSLSKMSTSKVKEMIEKAVEIK